MVKPKYVLPAPGSPDTKMRWWVFVFRASSMIERTVCCTSGKLLLDTALMSGAVHCLKWNEQLLA